MDFDQGQPVGIVKMVREWAGGCDGLGGGLDNQKVGYFGLLDL